MTPKFYKRRLEGIKQQESQRAKTLKAVAANIFVFGLFFAISISSPEENKAEAYVLPSEMTTEIRLTEIVSAEKTASPANEKKEPLQIWKSPYGRNNSKTKNSPKAPKPQPEKPRPTSAFDRAVAVSLMNEGGYTPSDSNGYPAKYGINQRYYRPLPGYPKHVKNLTKQQAIKYYKTFYYSKDWDQKKYSTNYKAFLLDSSIQHGQGFAKKLETSTSGDIKKAVNYRLCHVQRWAKREGKKHLLAGINKRIRQYERGIV